MKKRLSIVLVVLLAAAIGIGVWKIRGPNEPFHEGKPLSIWLNDYWIVGHGFDAELMAKTNHEVDKVVRQIGTNAIPTLFRMLTATDSPLRKLTYVAENHGYYHFSPTGTPALAQNIQAMYAFRALGAEAKDAVPQLIQIYDRSPSGGSREFAAFALGRIGPPASNAIPSLLRALTNTASFGNTLSALGEIHAAPAMVVPVLIKLLKSPDADVRDRAIVDLEAFGADALPAVPALIESLTDQMEYIRKHAARALKIIDPEAAANAGVQ